MKNPFPGDARGQAKREKDVLGWAVRELRSSLEKDKEQEVLNISEAWLKVWGKGGPEDTAFIQWIKSQDDYLVEIKSVNRRFEQKFQNLEDLRALQVHVRSLESKIMQLERREAEHGSREEAQRKAHLESTSRITKKEKELREQESTLKDFSGEFDSQRAKLNEEWDALAKKYADLVADAEKDLGDQLLTHHRESRENIEQAHEKIVQTLLAAFQDASSGLSHKAEEGLRRLRDAMQASEKEAKGMIQKYFAGLRKQDKPKARPGKDNLEDLEVLPEAEDDLLAE